MWHTASCILGVFGWSQKVRFHMSCKQQAYNLQKCLNILQLHWLYQSLLFSQNPRASKEQNCLDTWGQQPHGLEFLFGQFLFCSHRLLVLSDHCIPWEERICQLCHLQEVEPEKNFIFRCPIYYKICVRYHCLSHDSGGSLSMFHYCVHRFIAFFKREEVTCRWQTVQDSSRSCSVMLIISIFQPTSALGGAKCCADHPEFCRVCTKPVRLCTASLWGPNGPSTQGHRGVTFLNAGLISSLIWTPRPMLLDYFHRPRI